MDELKIIALTHRNTDIDRLGFIHLDEANQKEKLPFLKERFGFSELMFLSTCNRVELILATSEEITPGLLCELFLTIKPELDKQVCADLAASASVYSGDEALRHLFSVASSLDSLVVGEREIITQVRKAFEFCRSLNLTGDRIRLAVQQTIVTAKEIYTQTNISRNPVSVVSLAYRKLRELNISNEARFIVIGAGETNTTMAKYLKKHAYANFAIFNRTLAKAEVLASELNGRAYPLDSLKDYIGGFDVIISCTGADEPLITAAIYEKILCGETNRKVVIDLAVPNDLDAEVLKKFDVNLIAVSNLREVAKENLAERESEMEKCREIIEMKMEETAQIFREREIELAFADIPQRVREIKEIAINEVFAKDLDLLDEKGKEVLDRVLCYMEKKYNAVAMKTAKEALLEK